MSNENHTPGPWEAVRNSTFWEVDIQDCFSVAYVWGDDEKQAEANARLIAAAPELLEVAISNAEYRAACDSEFGRGYNAAKNGQRRDVQKESADWYAGYDARASIAKATGSAG